MFTCTSQYDPIWMYIIYKAFIDILHILSVLRIFLGACFVALVEKTRSKTFLLVYSGSTSEADGWIAMDFDSSTYQDLLPGVEKLKATQAKVISFNASISACEKAEQWQLAIHLLQEALQTVQARFHDLKLVGFGLGAVMMNNFSWKRTCN